MKKKYFYRNGDELGDFGCVYIKDTPGKIRMALFVCPLCGNHFTAKLMDVKRNNTKSCGCRRSMNGKHLKKHGLSKHGLFSRWMGIKERCYRESDKSYNHYGARGISMHTEWIKDFKAFYDYVMALPNAMMDGYSIDRIDNDGNYEPGNIKWSTHSEQRSNRRA